MEVNLNEYLAVTLLVVGFIAALGLYVWWRLWRGFLAPPTPMCDRGHIKTINYFWMLITGGNLFVIWWLGRQVYIVHWLKWKETLGLENVPLI